MPHAQPDGYLAVPSTGTGHGVLVLHAWWGLNDTIKAFSARLAASGFVAFAPDLYHGKVADTIADAETLGSALDANHLQAKAEIAEATRFLDDRPGQSARGLAVIGFSLGAYSRWISRPPTPNISVPWSSSTGPGLQTSPARKQPISVTLPRTMSLSRHLTSIIWKQP